MKKREKIQDDIDDAIENEIEKALVKVEKDIDREVKEDVKRAIERKVKERVEKEVESEIGVTESDRLLGVQIESRINRNISFLRSSLHFCWAGVCKMIVAVFVITYLIIIALMFTCAYTTSSICLTQSFGGAMPYIIVGVVMATLISVFLSLFAPNPRLALVMGLILDIPMIILVLFITAQYIGLIIIAIVILVRLIQGTRR